MAKIKINFKIKSSDDEIIINDKPAILKDNKIYYTHDNVNHVITLCNNSVILGRNSDESELLLEFEHETTKNGKYEIKDINFNMDIKTVTRELLIGEDEIKIKYDLYINGEKSDSFIYELDWRQENEHN